MDTLNCTSYRVSAYAGVYPYLYYYEEIEHLLINRAMNGNYQKFIDRSDRSCHKRSLSDAELAITCFFEMTLHSK